MMEFAHPERLAWLWLVPVAAALLWLARARRRRRLAAFAGAAAERIRIAGALKIALLVAVVAALVGAVARPRWGFEWRDVRTTGGDIVVAVDVSRSMLATDVDPSRMERARRKVLDLLTLLRGDRVGLVAFAGDAFVQCPVTEDYAAARMFVGYLDTDLIPVQGTDLGRAIRVATKALTDGGRDETTGKAIVLITDGEDQEGNAEAAAAEAKALGIRIYTVGIGSEGGAPIPEAGGGFKKDATGSVVLTKPDEAALQRIAAASDGAYVRAGATDADVAQLYADGIAKALAGGPERGTTTRKRLWHERFQWLLGLAAVLLVGEAFLRDVRMLALALLLGGAFAGTVGAPRAEAAEPKAGEDSFAAGDYAAAEKAYLDGEIEKPDDPRYPYNRAVSQYKGGKLDAAAAGFAKAAEAAAKAENPELHQRSLFNLGNAEAGRGRYDEAIAAYERLLKAAPEDREAQENLAQVRLLKEQKQKQEKQKQEQKRQEQEKEEKQKEMQEMQEAQADGDEEGLREDENGDQELYKPKPDEKEDGEKQDGQKKDEQGEKGEKKDEQGEKQGPEETPGPQEQQAAAGDEKPEEGQASAAPRTPTGEMTQEQADQVLRSVQDDPRKFLGPARARSRRDNAKDW